MVHNRFLRENKDFMRAAIGLNPLALKEARVVLANRELVLAAVKADGLTLEFAAQSLKDRNRSGSCHHLIDIINWCLKSG